MSAFLDETGVLITVDHSNPLPIALVAGFTSLNDGELKTASYANPLPVTVVTTDYTEAELPDADDVAVGTEVFNTTYQVKMISNGTRWIPLAPFFVYVAKLADEVTGTTALTLLREIPLPHQYIGKNGNIEVFLGSLNNSTANTKRIVVSLFDGTTTFDIYNVISTTTGKTMAKTIQAVGIEYDFYTSSASASTDGASNISPNGQALNPALTTLTMRISGQLTDVGDWARLSRLAIKINGGF